MPHHRSRTLVPLLVLVGLYVLAIGAYFGLRFAGRWSEGDTAALLGITERMLASGRLVSAAAEKEYPYGPGYLALSVFVARVAGVAPQALFFQVYALAAAFLVPSAFVLYRSLTGSSATGLLATVFLFLQPDFLWVTVRGSHEKLTWTLVLTATLLLAKSFVARKSLAVFTRYVLLFYLVIFALINTNAFFGSSFIVALAVGAVAGWVLIGATRRAMAVERSKSAAHMRRLLLAIVSCSILLYLFLFYLYAPARYAVYALNSMANRIGALALGLAPQFNPYEYIGATWRSTGVYLALTLFNYIVLATSFIVWLRGVPRLLRLSSHDETDLSKDLLWLFYAAFAAQLAASALADRGGLFGGNLQVRLFTPFIVFAIPLSALALQQAMRRVPRGAAMNLALALVALSVAWLGPAALLKATNEPLLSNRWLFYTSGETRAGEWMNVHIASARVWLGDERLVFAMESVLGRSAGFGYDAWAVDPGTSYYLYSTVESAMDLRVRRPEPYLHEAHDIYDNGAAHVYYRRPSTPYQR